MIPRQYYELMADPEEKSRWYLKSPLDPNGNEVDPRIFTQGTEVARQPELRLPIRRPGREVDLNLCDFDMVVTPRSLNEELEKIVGNSIQRIAIKVDGHGDEYEILNVCRLVSCVDESKSLLTKWAVDDGRPDKVGQYRMIVDLFIDTTAVEGNHIFRVSGWPIAVIVSEEVKRFLERRGTTGLKFRKVS